MTPPHIRQQNNNDGIGCVVPGIILAGMMGFGGYAIQGMQDNAEMRKAFKVENPPKTTIMQDINGDGLEDIIEPTGHIQLQKKDGTFVDYNTYFVREQARVQVETTGGETTYSIKAKYQLE